MTNPSPPPIPAETSASIVRNVLQGIQSTLELHVGEATLSLPQKHLTAWQKRLHEVLKLLEKK